MTAPSWPYPSYADRRWLGGEGGADRELAAVVRTLRSTIAEAGHRTGGDPDALLMALAQLSALAERIDWAMLSLVGEARSQAASWAAIGTALGVTKQAAQQRFGPYVRAAMEQARDATTT